MALHAPLDFPARWSAGAAPPALVHAGVAPDIAQIVRLVHPARKARRDRRLPRPGRSGTAAA
jgi:hypothetical protein